jgi:nucleolar complex protein 3
MKHCTASGLLHSDEDGSQNNPTAQGHADQAAASSTVLPGHTAGTLGWSRERVLRKFPLLNPSLEGLARYTHLISVEYFNDIMEVFKQVKVEAQFL